MLQLPTKQPDQEMGLYNTKKDLSPLRAEGHDARGVRRKRRPSEAHRFSGGLAVREKNMTKAVAEKFEESGFLGITHSAKGLIWRERLDEAGRNQGLALSQIAGIPEILGRVLAARGATIDTVENWLNPSLKEFMPDPHVMQHMEIGATRLAEAIVKQQKIAIFGDYDVDGAVSSALMKLFISAHNSKGGPEPQI